MAGVCDFVAGLALLLGVAWAILTILTDTMILRTFEYAHNFAGLITVAGSLVVFVLTKLTVQ